MYKRFKNIKQSLLWQACAKNWKLVVVVSLSLIGQTAMTILQPWPIKTIIDQLIQKVPTAGEVTGTKVGLFHFAIGSIRAFLHSHTFDFLYLGIGSYLVIILINSLFLYLQNICMTKLGQRVILDVRSKLFSYVLNLPHSFFDKARSGDITSRISKDTAELQDILTAFIIIVVRSLPTIIGILVIAFVLDWIYALTFVFLIPLVFYATAYFSKRTKQAMRYQRRFEGALASTAQEAIYYHAAVASLSLEHEIADDLLVDGKLSADRGIQAGRYQGLLTSSVEFAVSSTTAVVLFIGALRIMHGCLTVGQMMIFLSYLNSLFKPIRQFAKFTGKVAKSLASNERIEEIMRIDPSDLGAGESTDADEAGPFDGHICFKDIDFSYSPEKLVLKNFNLEINPGEKVALVGNSGCGKSTVLNLLMRFYDSQKGSIEIDGKNIRKMTLNSLRAQIATVLQDSFIFDATIRENIALAKNDATNDEIIQAAKAAKAHDFIEALEDGYATHLGEGGAGLSGGQKRRLSIARAILRDVPIVVLDEPTVGLDAASERFVIDAIDSLTANKTTLIVTHQLSTIKNADRIIVMVKGKVAETGNHDELIDEGGIYYNLWKDQQGQNQESGEVDGETTG